MYGIDEAADRPFSGVSAQFLLFSPFNLFLPLCEKKAGLKNPMIVFIYKGRLSQILKEERYGIYIVGYRKRLYAPWAGWEPPLLLFLLQDGREGTGVSGTLGYIVCLTLVFLRIRRRT